MCSAGPKFVNKWLGGHLLASQALGKPFVLEEFGVVADDNDEARTQYRDPIYKCDPVPHNMLIASRCPS